MKHRFEKISFAEVRKGDRLYQERFREWKDVADVSRDPISEKYKIKYKDGTVVSGPRLCEVLRAQRTDK